MASVASQKTMIEKIIISQTRQVQQYEPLRIEVHLDGSTDNWAEVTAEAIETIDRLLYPEKYESHVTTEDLEKSDTYTYFEGQEKPNETKDDEIPIPF